LSPAEEEAMLRRMLIKEWKEKFGLVIFALVGLLLFSLALFGYSKDRETIDILVSTILFIFLPAFSLLLGASGFASEFQEGAWAYLFSRPVKKWRVWLAKYFSLLTILYAVVLLFDLLIRLHPALKSANDTIYFLLVRDMSSYRMLVFLLPLPLFTTAFSFSIVSDKPYRVVFLAALIWIALQMALTGSVVQLLNIGVLPSGFSALLIIGVIFPLSFVLASLLALNKADFSQPRSRAWTFTKYAAIFVPASIALVALVTLGLWKLRSERYIYDLEASNNAVYFAADKGFFQFDLADGRTEKIARNPSRWGQMSLSGDKLAFVSYHFSGKWRGFAELRIMKSNGQEERSLVGTWDEKSPLYGCHLYPVRMSRQGGRVVFIARYGSETTGEDLWAINSDGSDLRGYDLGIPDAEHYRFISFGESERTLFLLCTIKIKPGSRDQQAGAKLLRVSLESGRVETLAEQIRKPYAASMPTEAITSGTEIIAYVHFNEAMSREILTVLDPETLEKRQVYPEDSVVGFRCNKGGDKLAFLTANSMLGVYATIEDKVVQTKELIGYDLRWPSQALEWTPDDQLILRKSEGELSYLCILNTNLTEHKAIRLPFMTYYPAKIWTAGNFVIVEDTERHRLWGVDLTTEKWVKVY
jgi:ABC-type transport system involved in multi-copper enzyme maturation permease subunit